MESSQNDFLKILDEFLEENQHMVDKFDEVLCEDELLLDDDILDIDDVPSISSGSITPPLASPPPTKVAPVALTPPDTTPESSPNQRVGTSPNTDNPTLTSAPKESEAQSQCQPGPSSTSATKPRSLDDKIYDMVTIEGQSFKITFAQMQAIPFHHIRTGKRKRYNVFLSKGESVRLKLRKNKLIWTGYRKTHKKAM